MSEYSKFWDETVKPAALDLIEIATTDKVATEYYVGGMIWAVEHDIADGREPGLNSGNALLQVRGVFSDDGYFEAIHSETPVEEINKMKNLSKLIDEMINKGRE